MKRTSTLALAAALAFASNASAAEQVLIDWSHTWDYFHPMGDDPAADDAGTGGTNPPNIDNAGAGAGELVGPDMIYPNFNGATNPAGAWFAKDSDFNDAFSGYAANIGVGFGIGGAVSGNPLLLHTFDSGSGAGPLGYEAINYFGVGGAEMTAFGTTLTIPSLVTATASAPGPSVSNNHLAAYFRTTFNLGQDFTKPRIRMLLDDGALIYLDGVLIARVNKANNNEGYRQFAININVTPEAGGTPANNEGVIQAFPLDIAGTSTTASSFVTVAVPKLTAGLHTLAVSVRHNNTTSSDMAFGLKLYGDDAGISAQVLNLVRLDNNGGAPTPTNVADDTFRFDVEVTPINLGASTTWTSDNPGANGPTSGSYEPTASVYTFTYPAQASASSPLNSATITFTDGLNSAVTSTVVATSPDAAAGGPLTLAPATPIHSTGFEESPDTTLNQVRRVYNTEIGFASTTGSGPVSNGGATAPGGVYLDTASTPADTTKSWRCVGSGGSLTTEAIALHPSVKGIQASLKARAFSTSGSTFEDADIISASIETSPDGITWTAQGNVLPVMTGAATASQPGADRIITLLGQGAASTNNPNYTTLQCRAIPVGAGAAFVRMRFDANGSVTTENVLIDDLTIEIGLDPAADQDGDGFTNRDEELWGSDLALGTSIPGITSRTVAENTPVLGTTSTTLTFETGNPFYLYTVRVSDDLVTWTDTISNGTGSPYSFLDENPGPRRYIFVRSNY